MIQLFGLARIGRDAELRSTSNGDQVASVSLAFNYGRKGQDGKRPTQWVDGAIWGQRAEALAPYLTKGTAVAVTFEDAHIETFKKSDGSEGTKLAGRITSIDLAGGGEQRQASPAPAPAQRQQPRTGGQRDGFDDIDDRIPFSPIPSRLEI
jgi:single-strand DNA-binding protein